MTNDLRILKKELKSFAKRVKDFKYTDSALITFLLTGLIMLSGLSLNLYSDEIKAQQEAINTSITQIRKDFKRARQENNKLLRNTNLELIQLMEQGDQVVKSPWSSWQFGVNEFYNDWHTAYKGRNDKKDEGKYVRSKSLSRYEYDRNAKEDQYTSGTTRLKLDEADREHEVSTFLSASLRTLSVNKRPPVISIEKPSGGLPPFKPLTVKPPIINPKTVNISQIPTAPPTDVAYQNVPNWTWGYNVNNTLGNNALMAQLEIISGIFNNYFSGVGQPLQYNFSGASENTAYTPSGSATHLPASGAGSSISTAAFYTLSGKA